MKIAIIDIGTNTINLLIAEKDPNSKAFIYLCNHKIAARLGAGGIHENTITAEAFERGFKAIEEHLTTIKRYEVDRVFAFATAALRKAKNGLLFKEGVKDLFNLTIEIITGSQEATFIYQGVKEYLTIGKDAAIIMDIGGGSVEFIICNETGIQWMESFDVGVSLLLEKFKPHDPLLIEEQEIISRYLTKELTPLWLACKQYPSTRLIGASGSFDTCSAILEKDCIAPLELLSLLQEFTAKDYNQRAQIPRIDPDRIQYMPMASILIGLIIRKLNIQAIERSAFALKEGALHTQWLICNSEKT